MTDDLKEADENYSGHDGLSSKLKLYMFFLLMFQGLFRCQIQQ